MKDARLKQILAAAAKLPPVKARALITAVQAKDAPEPDRGEAFATMQTAMIEAALAALENPSEP